MNDSTTLGVDERGIAEDTIAYWEGDAARYYGFEVEFHFTDNDYNSGMSVYFVEDVYDHVEECGTNAIGCIVPAEHGPFEVYIDPCEEREDTLMVLKHEFGHYLGFEHGDEPKPLMDPVTVNCS